MIKLGISVQGEGKEYPDMTQEQIKKMVEYLNQGMTEEEAKAKAMNND